MIRQMLITTGFALMAGLVWQSGKLPATSTAPPDGPTEKAAVELPERVVAEGRMVAYPGAEVVVGTEVAGLIVSLPVEEKARVRKGDVVAELRSDDLRASLAESRAKVAEAEADIRYFEREVKREQSLMSRGVGASQTVDDRRHELDTAQARRAAGLASSARLEAEIAKTKVLAPIDGVVMARHTHPGEIVDKAAKLVTIVDLDRLRVEAEVDEFDSARVALGAEVVVTSEGFERLTWAGKVEEIPDSVTGRRVRPEDPGRPIDARVLAVKVKLADKHPLKLGQRVEVEILGPDRTIRAAAR